MTLKNDFFSIMDHIRDQATPQRNPTFSFGNSTATTSSPFSASTQARAAAAAAADADVDFAPIDLMSNVDSYEIWVNMPGFEKDSIEVTIQDKVLKIIGKKSIVTRPEKKLSISRRECPNTVCHQVKLKTPIDVQKTENSLIAGVFYLKLYKSQPDEGVRIPL